MAAEFDMDTEIDGELDAEFDAEMEKLYAEMEMDELLFDQKGYDKLPNSLAELETLKAALPEKQRAESQRIEQARADLEESVESFKANVIMPENPEKEYKSKRTLVKVLRILGILIIISPFFHLDDFEDEVYAIPVFVLGGILFVWSVVADLFSDCSYPSKDKKAEYQLACTDFEAYKEKKAKEFADKRERELREREFKLKDEARLIDRKIREVQAEMDYRAKHKPKCPTCGSERVAPIGEAERWMDSTGLGTVVGGGLNSPSLGKSYRCFNCGYRW